VSFNFFDTTAFHRVIPGFMIQGGDPNSRHGPTSTWGFGQPNQPTVNAEFTVAKHLRGILSAARSSNPNSATSQFFICVAAAPNLNNNYSVYGRVVSGMNIVDTIVNAPRNSNDLPNVKHEMFITKIGSNDTVPNAPSLILPANGTGGINIANYLQLKWSSVPDAIIYNVEVSDDFLFQNIVQSFDSPNLSQFINGLSNFTVYYWRVRTNNGGHFSPWSQEWTFNTFDNAVGINKQTGITDKPIVFPNPGAGKFTFSKIERGTTIQIFDITGREIFETVSKENSAVVDLEGKNKGVYFYRTTNLAKEVQQGKLIVK
jgi:peptidyl-prolyl cis-trans isomerase B (cyclophilin B)